MNLLPRLSGQKSQTDFAFLLAFQFPYSSTLNKLKIPINEKEFEAIELAAGVLQQFKVIKVNDSNSHLSLKAHQMVTRPLLADRLTHTEYVLPHCPLELIPNFICFAVNHYKINFLSCREG
jgi:hypothetical protein